jgi:hypothetical protein
LYLSGVQVRERYSTVTPDQMTGYAVAVLTTGPRALAGQTPVWFGGGKLAPDLSLPQLQARWATRTTSSARTQDERGQTQADLGETSAQAGVDRSGRRPSTPTLTDQERRRVWQLAQDAVADGTEQIRQATGMPAGSAGLRPGRWAPHRRTVPSTATSRRMRTAAGLLLQSGIVKRAETRQLLELLDRLNRLVAAVAVLREL